MTEPQYGVVINHELQFSLWPQPLALPLGWVWLGYGGTRQDCLQHIEATWIDMRPLSARIGPQPQTDPVTEALWVDGFVASDIRGWCFGCPAQAQPLTAHSQAAGPLAFSRGREDALANAAAAAASDPRYRQEFLGGFFAASLLRDGMRLFQARGQVCARSHSQLWAEALEIGPELELSSSPLWGLWLGLVQDHGPELLCPGT